MPPSPFLMRGGPFPGQPAGDGRLSVAPVATPLRRFWTGWTDAPRPEAAVSPYAVRTVAELWREER